MYFMQQHEYLYKYGPNLVQIHIDQVHIYHICTILCGFVKKKTQIFILFKTQI